MSVWQRTLRLAASAGLVAAGLIVGLSLAGTGAAIGTEAQEAAPAVIRDATDLPAMVPQGTFVEVAERLRPTVVFIQAARPQQEGSAPSGFDRFFEDFFGGEPEDSEDQRPEDQFENLQRSQGSGVLVSGDGFILTNAHVVAAFNVNSSEMDLATDVQVTLFDDRFFDAEIIGADLGTDIALLKIDGRALEYAMLGNSENIRVGEWVMAVGAPFGLQNTVSAGIVSALGRAITGMPTTSYQDFVQTDAAINPGNSGGPLVNLRGEVIGINTAIATGGSFNPSFSGVGFAVPVNLAHRVMDQLREHGRVIRGYLGVTVQPLTRDLREAYDLAPRVRGAIVNTVTEGGPAATAGLLPEDIVIGMDGDRLQSQQDFLQRIAAHAPGEAVDLTVVRGSDELELTVTLTERPDEAEIIASQFRLGENRPDRGDADEDEAGSGLARDLGLQLTDLTSRLASRLRLPDGIDGVVVSQVAPNSPAALAGLEQRDVIMGINRMPVGSVEEFEALVTELGDAGRPLSLRIYDYSQRSIGFRSLRMPRD